VNDYKKLDIYQSFIKSKLWSTKANIFFHVYEEIFQKFRNKEIIFVEIGVKRGGSLLMWRDWLGPKARIIGIDLDPNAKKLEEHGFEIFIGDQSSPDFWSHFFKTVGNVDIILDDGAHTNEAQIITTINCINHINDGGLLVIEDAISSFEKKFFNPQKYSFLNYSKSLIDDIFVRCLKGKTKEKFKKKISLNDKIYSIKFFSDFVVFEINRLKCIDREGLQNKDLNDNSYDKITTDELNYINPRWSTDSYKGVLAKFIYYLSKVFFFMRYIPFSKHLSKKIIFFKGKYYNKKISAKLKKYFE
tara:strand:+ start:4337 stop:5242 length:906 start_codon:yes stop_codon:yes gene_type:complete